MKKFKLQFRFLMSVAFFISLVSGNSQMYAQGNFVLSKKADFSTNNRLFSREDTLYMKVSAPKIDYTDIDKNEFKLKANSGGDEFEGSFTNLLDGTYESQIVLSTADPNTANWQWEARIRDDSGQEFRVEVDVQIIDAATPIGEDVKIRGAIASLGTDFLQVNGSTIFVTANTQVFDNNNVALMFADLLLNDFVEVQAVRNEQGDLVAVSIKLENRRMNQGNGEVELTGLIESVGANNIVVFGDTFFVDATTEILNLDKNPISLTDLKVGDLVRVRADMQSDGTLLATRIRLEDPERDEVEFTGTIDALTETSVSVNGVLFLVTSDTDVLDNDDVQIAFSVLEVGMVVEIRGDVGAGNVLTATKINIEDRGNNFGDDEIEITGEVTEIAGNAITVSGFIFTVDDSTDILNNNNQPIPLSDIQIGALVEVRANRLNDGTLLATKIKLEDNFNDEVDLSGVIEEIGDHVLTVNGFSFIVTDSTVILDNNNQMISFASLQVGDLVEIRADVASDGSLITTKIKIEDMFNDEVELTATIEKIHADSIVVGGVAFLVDANTIILNKQNIPIAFAQLQVGMLVEIRGDVQADGTILATKIKVEDRIVDEVELRGTIEELTDNSVTLLGKTFGVTENTAVFDNNNNTISFADLFVGLSVEIRGDLMPDGSLIAIRIKVEDNLANEVKVVGPIDSLDVNFIQVVGVEFQVDGNTVVLDKSNNSITFADLQVGQTVEVQASVQAGGVNLATKIKIEDVTLLASKLTNVVFNGIEMLGRQILVDSSTMILGRLNRPLNLSDLQPGQVVDVRMQKGNGNLYFATKVKVQEPGLITGIKAGIKSSGTPPDDFVLLQNYPNPFNPETTVSFQVPNNANGLVNTKVTVFNLLGQRVRILVNAPMNPGVYQVKWNGRDERGITMASGVYLYRLETGVVTKTQRMLLLK